MIIQNKAIGAEKWYVATILIKGIKVVGYGQSFTTAIMDCFNRIK